MDNLVNVNMDLAPSEKLSEVISTALGAWIVPWHMKRLTKAEAEADRIKALESAKTEALLAGDEERYQTLSVIGQRVVAKEIKRKENIEKVVEVANQIIKDEPNVSSEPANPDWATRFFNIAQDISEVTLQNLWGRILAGEVKQPNSYSLRTLDALQNITCEEAQLFEKVAQYVLFDNEYYILNTSGIKSADPISCAEIAKLIEIGFVQPGSLVTRNYHNDTGRNREFSIVYGDYVIMVNIPGGTPCLPIPFYPLTKVGQELYHLISKKSDDDYLNIIASAYKKADKRVQVRCAKIILMDKKGNISYNTQTLRVL